MTPENQVVNSIVEWIRLQPRRGFVSIYYNGTMRGRKPGKWFVKGHSDLIGDWCGKALYIEVKAPGEKPDKDQLEFLEARRKTGAIAFWTDSVHHAIGILQGASALPGRLALDDKNGSAKRQAADLGNIDPEPRGALFVAGVESD